MYETKTLLKYFFSKLTFLYMICRGPFPLQDIQNTIPSPVVNELKYHILRDIYITCQNLFHMPYQHETPTSTQGPPTRGDLSSVDAACDTYFDTLCSLYHVF